MLSFQADLIAKHAADVSILACTCQDVVAVCPQQSIVSLNLTLAAYSC